MPAYRLLSLALIAALPVADPLRAHDLRPPLSPQQALKHFRLAPGLRIELAAAEPVIEAPVAMAFDEDGRLFVVEMRDYPNGPKPGDKPQGRIKLLEDRDGDGVYERSTVFADELLFANGLMPWKGGLVVTAAPHLVYLKDTDGDGKADKREVLYEGFAAENPQLRVSHPTLGLDGWVYVANGLRGGQVRAAGQRDAKPINLSGMDFRFNLGDGRHEAISGPGQYGNCFDDWGRRFVCDNRHHLRHVVIEDRYLKRNPYLAATAVLEDISDLDREEGPLSSGGKIYPLSKNWTTSALHAGRFTAACGVQFYRGDLLAAEFRGCAFTCDPTGNLVHQEVLSPNGATFRSKPAKQGTEFLATPDDWFRPVFLYTGPDGAFYIVDMYRAVIEHPEYMPVELKNRPDLLLGKERGRIWRIVPEKHVTRTVRPNLGKATNDALLDALAAGNAWTRMTAHRLLLERADRPDPKALVRLLPDRAADFWRLHVVCLLGALDAADETTLDSIFLHESNPEILEHAVRIAEPWLARSKKVRDRVIACAGRHPRLDYQIALSLGAWDDDGAVEPLAKIALSRAEDRWTRLAVASAVPQRAGLLIAALLGQQHNVTKETTPGRLRLLTELTTLVGARRDPNEVAATLRALAALGPEGTRWQMTGLDGLAEGMGRRGIQLGAFLQTLPEKERSAARIAEDLLAKAAVLAGNAKADAAERLTAVRLTAHAPWDTAAPLLAKLITGDGPQELRLAAVRALAAHSRPEVAGLLLKPWPGYTPALRREVAEAMLRQPDRALALLREVEAKHVRPGDLDALRTRQLVGHGNPQVRELARKLLQGSLPAERQKVLEEYRAALKMKGDPKRGLEVFRKNCATCHRLAGVGVNVAPDIADAERTRTHEQLLTDILNPNAAIDSNYVNYEVTLKNGRVLTGIIAAETASSLTLRRAENQSDVVLRQDVEEVRSSGVSLMPEGLEKQVSVAEMADLLSFLKNWRYLDGGVPVGKGQ